MKDCLFIENFDITHLRYAKANINGRYLTHDQIQHIRSAVWQKIMKNNLRADC